MNYTKREVIVIENVEIVNLLPDIGLENTQQEILEGLNREEKHISSKFFYDEKGSKLFEDITDLKEYYPTRTERGILKQLAKKIGPELSNIDIIELGSGDCSKINILLNEIPKENLSSINYIPVDFSQSALEESADQLIEMYPELNIQGFVADFINQLDVLPNNNPKLICFFGSTIGNLEKKQAQEMIIRISQIMNPGDRFLLGMDRVKPEPILHAAYNDSLNVTSEFNKNIINVVNGIIGTSFNTNDFEHLAFFNKEKSRIEMHLKVLHDISSYALKTDEYITLKKGETIHTENSHKYTIKQIEEFSQITNLNLAELYSDSKDWFTIASFIK